MTEQRTCIDCEKELPLSDFPKRTDYNSYRPYCNQCQYLRRKARRNNDPVLRKKHNRAVYEWKKKNMPNFREKNIYGAMKVADRKRGHSNTLTFEEYLPFTKMNCHYCGEKEKISVDRVDSNRGHELDNLVPCCHKCNYILGDLPSEAKEILKDSLTKIKQKELLKEWEIPTKRKKGK